LQGRQEEANQLLDDEDWSASDTEFLICVAAVRGEVNKVVRLMGELCSLGSFEAQRYRSWPVFRGLHSNATFMAAFEAAYGEPLNLPKITPMGAALRVESVAMQ
jgi:hypothetical protein